jgi:hypothetical protein
MQQLGQHSVYTNILHKKIRPKNNFSCCALTIGAVEAMRGLPPHNHRRAGSVPGSDILEQRLLNLDLQCLSLHDVPGAL